MVGTTGGGRPPWYAHHTRTLYQFLQEIPERFITLFREVMERCRFSRVK